MRRLSARRHAARLLMAVGCVAVAVACTPAPPGQPAPPATGHRWAPAPGQPWQWQLQGTLNLGLPVPTYDVDGQTTAATVVTQLHAMGKRAICYVDVGSYENFRPDASKFPRSVIGKENGWPGERWLDVRRIDVLAPLLDARFAQCRAKGFDAVEPDNVDGYSNDTGFPLTADDQLRFNRWVAGRVHALGLGVALKNDLDQVPQLVSSFDFAVNEECFRYDECSALRPFTAAGKAVLQVEYDLPVSAFCPAARRAGFASMRKDLDLTAWRQPC